MTISHSTRITAKPHVFFAEVDDELVLFDPEKGHYFGAGQVGGRVWSLIKEQQSVETILDEIEMEFDIDRVTCEKDILTFLEELRNAHLIEVSAD
ncbi:MAG: PqqD family peptide modification chaperone [Pseudomonadota bacterium]